MQEHTTTFMNQPVYIPEMVSSLEFRRRKKDYDFLGLFYPSLKANIEKYIRPITSETKEWLDSLKTAGKTLFLMTSSYADYAKFILSKILVDETGKPIDYWKYFDICIGDARKPDFFLKEDPFCKNKNDYPFEPVDEIKPKTWYSQGEFYRYFRCIYSIESTF